MKLFLHLGFMLSVAAITVGATEQRPNIILMMADDTGYGDTGFNGNTIIQTPHMDALAAEGVRLTHFYSGNSVCSPTRATCLTGRHHDRMGIYYANVGHLPAQEITLAKMLKTKGYTTGHFGKWHLGTLSKTMSSKGERRKIAENFAPPWLRDYDQSFVTESAVCTWNPGQGKRAKDNPFFHNGVALDPDDPALAGGAARVVVDPAIDFIKDAAASDTPFLSVIWFHASHSDVEAGPEYLKRYPGHGAGAHYYGCITEMDEQVGRIHQVLKELGEYENTLIFFCSDNGPAGKAPLKRSMGQTDGLRGRKASLYDGGVRVPAFAVWPGKIPAGVDNDAILSTLDYFPTVKAIVGYEMPDARPVDGENIMPILTQQRSKRDKSIPFRFKGGISSLVKGGYKLVMPAGELYDLSNDRAEQENLAAAMPEKAQAMKAELRSFFQSVEKSHSGADYNDPTFKPVDPWYPLSLDSPVRSFKFGVTPSQ